MKKCLFALLGVIFFFVSCDKKEQEVSVTAVTIAQATAEMIIGETVQLQASVSPSNATDKTIIWASSKLSVATVNASGLVMALAEGTSTVTATAGGKSATCLVTVSKGVVAVTSVSLNKEAITLVKGHSETLVATVKPYDATDKTVYWVSSDPSVASVDDNGKVTATGGGSAVISAQAGNQQALCNVTVTVPVESVSLDRESLSLEEESSVTLVATVSPDDATDKSVTWSSSNTQIATVDESGTVTGVKAGTATITAKASGKSATCAVTVQKKFIHVTSVTLNKTDLTLTKGASETLKATVKPDNATDKTVTWSSSDPEIVTVDSKGKVKAKAGGTAIVTAKAEEMEASCTVNVTVPVESISLSPVSVTVEEESSVQLVATVKPDDATDQTVTWSSSNTQIATVDEEGEVTGVSVGKATITAQSGGKSATCTVTVQKKYIAVASIQLNKNTLSLVKGKSEALEATVSPDNASNPSVSWSSSHPAIAKVDSKGVVTALAAGNATITAKAEEKEATCYVTVTIPVEGVSLNKENVTLTEGTATTLVATVKPSDATDKTVSWTSSNPSVATVADGTVSALIPGTAEITVTTADGGHTAKCLVTVEVDKTKATDLSFDGPSLFVSAGRFYKLTVHTTPTDAICDMEWKSSNTSAVSVTGSGNAVTVTSHSASTGYQTVSVRDKRTGLSASIKVYSYIESFSWNESTDEKYSGYPLVPIALGGTHQLQYTSSAGSHVLNLFGSPDDLVLYEPNVVSTPTHISLSTDGLVTGLTEGVTGIKPTGYISAGGQRVYIKVISKLYESEYNDAQGNANTVAYGFPMVFDLMNASDEDWFKLLKPSSSGYVNVTISVEYPEAVNLTGNEGRLCKYALYDSGMQMYGAGSFSFSNTKTVASTTRMVPSGPLYLRVYFDKAASTALLPVGSMILRMTVD